MQYEVDVRDDVIVWEFPENMDQSAFGTAAFERYEQLLDSHDVTGMVTVVKMDEAFRSDTFEIWEAAGERAVEEGIERWAIVADGLKSMSLRSRVDLPELDIYTTDDRAEALDWIDA